MGRLPAEFIERIGRGAARILIRIAQCGDQRFDRHAAEAADRVHRGGPHAVILVAQGVDERRDGARVDDVAERLGRMRGYRPVLQRGDQAVDRQRAQLAQRCRGRLADILIRVVQRGAQRFHRLRIADPAQGAHGGQADIGDRITQEFQQLGGAFRSHAA